MSATILITGAGGQVGHELASATCAHRIVATSRQQLDITNSRQILDAVSNLEPDLIINAAAYTAVDRAEEEPKAAYTVNRDGVENLATACRDVGIPLLHISTDYVFDGEKQGAYVETDPVAPLGVYGASKLGGEEALRACVDRHIILRSSWVFSASGSNFVKTMLRLGRERDELGIVDDQHGCPTSARSIASVLLQIADRYISGEEIDWGTYHYGNAPSTTWFGFAREIFSRAGGFDDLELKPIATADYPTPARRPTNSVLDCSKLARSFGIRQADWRIELDSVLSLLARDSRA